MLVHYFFRSRWYDVVIQVKIQADLDELDDAGEVLEPIFALKDDPFDAEIVDTGDFDFGDVEDVEGEHLTQHGDNNISAKNTG
jgi:hypothetical protein